MALAIFPLPFRSRLRLAAALRMPKLASQLGWGRVRVGGEKTPHGLGFAKARLRLLPRPLQASPGSGINNVKAGQASFDGGADLLCAA